MVPSVSILNPPQVSPPAAVALRLNLEVLALLRKLHKEGTVPKLVVENGQFVCTFESPESRFHTNPQLIKVGDLLVYPCSSSNELLRFDIYNASKDNEYDFAGTVTERLNVLTDPRQIKDHQKAPVQRKLLLPNKPSFEHARKLSLNDPKAYSVDGNGDVTAKFLALLALGPTTRKEVESRINGANRVTTAEMDRLFLTHTQNYHLSMPNSSFTETDTYPSVALGLTDTNQQQDYLILKDKAYKDLRPWLCPFTPYERTLVIENAHHALSRLGYLDTHPLRRRITEKPLEKTEDKKPATLGGGLLSARSGSPSPKRSASPRVEEKRKRPRNDESPLKHNSETGKKFVASLLLSSSSEDERQSKKPKKEGQRSNSSGSNQSVFSNANSYTLPSLINEEHNDENDHSEDDMKLLNLPRASPALPSKPATTTNDKRQQYYKQLALNFYKKYLEYKGLHDNLLKDQSGTTQEKKRRVMKLFEMHNLLAGWKRKLWDYYNESNMAQGIMHLSRHKKTNSGSGVVLAPLTGQMQSQDRFQRSGTASPQVGFADRFSGKQNGKRALELRSPRPKVALDY